MIKLLFIPFLFASFFISVFSYSADLEKGKEAFQSKDLATAYKELKPLADKGNIEALEILYTFYRYGYYVKKDQFKALKILKNLYSNGSRIGQYFLGLEYYIGELVAKDINKTVELWEDLVKDDGPGSEKAWARLASIYSVGEGGIKMDQQKASQYAYKAASRGYMLAHVMLGFFYNEGIGVIVDYEYAYMWWNIAASQGDETSKKQRDILSNRMTASQISNAQMLSRKCIKNNYKGC